MSRFPLNGFTLDDEFVLFFGIVTNMATAECLWMDDDDRGQWKVLTKGGLSVQENAHRPEYARGVEEEGK